ncbi:MAG: glycosyltransferase [Acidiferrobacterales bacterium]
MLITVSYTSLDSSGGVPKFNRDLHAAFPGGKHYCWKDVCEAQGIPDQAFTEWRKASVLNSWLVWAKKISKDDFIVADSFWADGLSMFPRAVSHQHGNWCHVLADDTKAPPEFPEHWKAQQLFRQRWMNQGKKITAASDFLAEEMFKYGISQEVFGRRDLVDVINHGIDTERWKPATKTEKSSRFDPLIIHGVTNANKGFEHVQAVQDVFGRGVLLLDEAARLLELPKEQALAQADLVVVPSAYEGFGFFLLEAISCGVPVFAYDVGVAYKLRKDGLSNVVGAVYEQSLRNPHTTVQAVSALFQRIQTGDQTLNPRKVASEYGMDRFNQEWKNFFLRNYGACP